jgi:hypothetical protein
MPPEAISGVFIGVQRLPRNVFRLLNLVLAAWRRGSRQPCLAAGDRVANGSSYLREAHRDFSPFVFPR